MTELGLDCGAGTTEQRKEPSDGEFLLALDPCLALPSLHVGIAGLGCDHDVPTTIQTDAVVLQWWLSVSPE